MERTPRCAYERVCSDDGTSNTATGDSSPVWQCPHPANPDTEYCQFHTAIEEKDTDATTAALVEAITDPERSSTFVGAQFESLDLAGVALDGDGPIDLREVIVRRSVDLSDSTVDSVLRLDGATVGGDLFMQRLDASDDLVCRNLQTGGRWVLSEATIEGRLDAPGFRADALVATGAHVDAGVSLRKGAVDDQVGLGHARFEGPVWLSHTHIGGRLDSESAVYEDGFSLSHCTVDGDVGLQNATVDGGLRVEHLHVRGEFDATELHVSEGVDARSSQFDAPVDWTDHVATDGRLDFSYATFDAPVYFDAATIDTSVSFEHAQFDGGTVSFVRTAISGTVTFSGAHFARQAPFRMVETAVGRSVVCDHATFDGEVFWTGATVHADVDFSDCTVSTLEFGVEIGGGLDFAYTHVSESAGFTETVVRGGARFTSARFDTEPTLTDATLDGAVATYDLSIREFDSP